ncbi:MAG: Na+/H+ antiporter NhaC family protein [Oscillospiraceae bacterium]
MGIICRRRNPSPPTLHGGGPVQHMVTGIVIVTSSCAIAGIVEGTDLTARLGGRTSGGHLKTYQKTLVTGFVTAAIGCNQTIAIVSPTPSGRTPIRPWEIRLLPEISFAGTLAPVLVPWCIAAYTPTSQLDVHGLGWMPFAFLALVYAALAGSVCLADGSESRLMECRFSLPK